MRSIRKLYNTEPCLTLCLARPDSAQLYLTSPNSDSSLVCMQLIGRTCSHDSVQLQEKLGKYLAFQWLIELQFLKHGNGGLDAGRELLQTVLSTVKKKWGKGTEVIAFEEGYFKQKVQGSHNKRGMVCIETN